MHQLLISNNATTSKVHVQLLSPSYSGRAWVKLGDVDACKMHTLTLQLIATLLACICIYHDVISMNLDDLGDFPRSPPYFGYNSAGSENPVLCIFTFQGPIRTQIDGSIFSKGISIFVPSGPQLCSVFPSCLVFPQFCPSPCLKRSQGARTGGFPFS